MKVLWEFQEKSRKMPLTTKIYQNVLHSSGFSESERLVREAVQNSADALDAASPSRVLVRFNFRRYRSEAKQKLSKALRLADGPLTRLDKLGLRLGNSLETLEKPDIELPVLIIADYNTCGLGGKWDGTGPADHFGRLVVNLGIDDKSSGEEVLGGSFGFGKTVYGKASRMNIVVFYSVFEPGPETDGNHARFMATGLFSDHPHDGKNFSGFAFFGEEDEENPGDVKPMVDEMAHAAASACGLELRSENQKGTTILILDCDADPTDLVEAASKYWWPRLTEGGRRGLDIVVSDEETEYRPRPKSDDAVKPFFRCLSNARSKYESPPETKLYSYRRMNVGGEMKQLGTLSCAAMQDKDHDHELANRIALVRGSGMVIRYAELGSESLEPCVGVFQSHDDVEAVLAYSEPQLHNEWDPNSDRLKARFAEYGPAVVKSIHQRNANSFRSFQRMQEPPIPPTGKRFKELEKLLGGFLKVTGKNPGPPPDPHRRPISISVSEDRVERAGQIIDTAEVTLNVKEDHPSASIRCTISARLELLGDATQRILGDMPCQIVDLAGTVLSSGAPANAEITLQKGQPFRCVVEGESSAQNLTRLRIGLEG